MTTLLDKPTPAAGARADAARASAGLGARCWWRGRLARRGGPGRSAARLGHRSAIVIVALLLYLVALPLWSRVVENRRSAVDRFVTGLVWVALGLAFVPLVSLLWTVISEGSARPRREVLHLVDAQHHRREGRHLPRHHRHAADHGCRRGDLGADRLC